MTARTKAKARYKVGDLYLTTNQENPANTLGYGSWVLFGQGRATVGLSEINNTYSPYWTKYIGGIFGAYEHKLTEDEMPRHNHSYGSYGGMNDNKGNVMPDEPWEEGGKGSGTTLTSVVINRIITYNHLLL